MLSVKQGSIKYHFLRLGYDSTWDWTLVSRAIGEHSNHLANVRFWFDCKKQNPTRNEILRTNQTETLCVRLLFVCEVTTGQADSLRGIITAYLVEP